MITLRQLIPAHMDVHVNKAWNIAYHVVSTKMLKGDAFDHTKILVQRGEDGISRHNKKHVRGEEQTPDEAANEEFDPESIKETIVKKPSLNYNDNKIKLDKDKNEKNVVIH